MEITNLKQFEAFLKSRVPTREALFMGDIGLQRAQYFMRELGNPQEKIKVIHIAGTSGKGSTAYLMSHILQSQGFKVGLSISPHVFDIRERMQIDNKLPDQEIILKYFNQILPAITKMEKSKYGSPTFFEINVALAYYIFSKEKLDYAVMETGLGGTLDGTNVVTNRNKICLITKLGLDHTEILGKTISEIAQQKAGIIQENNLAISTSQTLSAKKVLENKSKAKNAELNFVSKKNYKVISSTPQETIFDFSFEDFKLKNIQLGLIGLHQAQNCSLALSCLLSLSKRDKFAIDEKLLRNTLCSIRIPGRMEIANINGQTVILDGAHNPQKMQTFVSNLLKIYPEQKFIFIVAFKKGKDFKKMLKVLLPVAAKIYLASFSNSHQDNLLASVDNQEIIKFLSSQNFSKFEILKDNFNLEKIIKQEKKPIVITGSLYFLGQIYPDLKK